MACGSGILRLLDIVASGMDILSAWVAPPGFGRTPPFILYSSTSMAAPHIAKSIAFLKN